MESQVRTKEMALTRFVHARRARKLRRRGIDVRFHHWSGHGRAVYVWHWA